MHWTIATLRLALEDSSDLSDDIKLAYKSGCLLADVGAVFMDIYKDIATDSLEFTQAIYDLAMSQNSDLAEAFAYGWRDHYIQDTTGNANYLYYDNQTEGPYNDYHKNYGWIDEYLRDESQFIDDYPINNFLTNPIYVNYDLIQDAYESLGISAPFQLTIIANITAMYAAFDTFILLNTKGWTEEQGTRIILEALRMAFSSYGNEEASPAEIALTVNEHDNEKLSFSEYVVSLFTEQEINELTQYYNIESTPISDGEAILKITKNDVESYNNALNRIVTKKISIIQDVESK